MTCLYRCGNACDHPVPNTSDNAYFGDVVNAEVSRRGVVRAGAVGALVLGFGGAAAGALAGAAPAIAAPDRPASPEASRLRPSRAGARQRRADLQADPAEHAGHPRRAERLRPRRGDPLG